MTTVYTTDHRFTEHHQRGHVEHAGRILAVWSQLEAAGLLARMRAVEPRMVEEELILQVHQASYIHRLKGLRVAQGDTVMLDPDTYFCANSYEIARLSAGGAVAAVDEVLSGRANNGLAAVRPPGHHAMPDRPMGFCLLGNVALAARFAQQAHGVERVMIVDYDIHHGNGTEAAFYDDKSVLFISTHIQPPFWPGTGAISDTGRGDGVGYTINVPLPHGSGDAVYSRIIEDVVWPAAERFRPELILVSAGFDAHWMDPVGVAQLTLTGCAHLTRELVDMANRFCEGKIVFVMEGGYDLDVLSLGMTNVGRALLGDPIIADPFGSAGAAPPRLGCRRADNTHP